MLKHVIATAAMAAVILGGGLARAGETGHDHKHAHEPKHNGVVVDSGHHHLELVATGGSLALHVSHDDGSQEDISAAKATATVLADGKTLQVTLAPSEGNALKGSGTFNAGKGTIVVITLTMPGHAAEQAKFVLE